MSAGGAIGEEDTVLQQAILALQEAKKDAGNVTKMSDLLKNVLAKVEEKEKVPAVASISQELKQQSKIEPIKELSKATMVETAEGSGKGAGKKNVFKPYCHCCKSKGHVMRECVAKLFCDVCESTDHSRLRCLIFTQVKQRTGFASLSGFAVDGLGFFHIPVIQT